MLILPYIDELDLYNEYKFDEPWDGPNNRKLASRMPRVFAFSGDYVPGNTTTNYLAVAGAETVWPGSQGLPSGAVKDEAGNTILIVENRGAGVHWMEPRDLFIADMDFTLNSTNGISSKYVDPAVATVNGTVFRLTPDITPQALRAMLSIKDSRDMVMDEKGGWHLLPDGRQRPLAK